MTSPVVRQKNAGLNKQASEIVHQPGIPRNLTICRHFVPVTINYWSGDKRLMACLSGFIVKQYSASFSPLSPRIIALSKSIRLAFTYQIVE